jgi:Peptidase M15
MDRLHRLLGCLAALLSLAVLSAPAAAVQGVPTTGSNRPDGQDHADYLAWLARSPEARAKVIAFKTFLDGQGVDEVLPTWQIVRTASMWRRCNGPRFEVAPFAEWQHIATTLRFVKTHVEPVIGGVEAVSGYRNEDLNECSGGSRQSAHRHFFALDLVPVRDLSRGALIRSICAIHGFRGPSYDIGLGFYTGLRFHLDSKGFRRWGADGSGDTSPCVTGVV